MLGVLGVVLGVTAIILTVSKVAKAAPHPESYIPTAEEIMRAQSTAELDAYYEQLNDLYISRNINLATYQALYSVYEARFYELVTL